MFNLDKLQPKLLDYIVPYPVEEGLFFDKKPVFKAELRLPEGVNWSNDSINDFINAFVSLANTIKQEGGILCPIVNLKGLKNFANIHLTKLMGIQHILGPQVIVSNAQLVILLGNSVFSRGGVKKFIKEGEYPKAQEILNTLTSGVNSEH